MGIGFKERYRVELFSPLKTNDDGLCVAVAGVFVVEVHV